MARCVGEDEEATAGTDGSALLAPEHEAFALQRHPGRAVSHRLAAAGAAVLLGGAGLALRMHGGGGAARGWAGQAVSLAADGRGSAIGACRMARRGDECFGNVVWAMTTGIRNHPEWYEGLSQRSPFEDFQRHLATTASNASCPEPCRIAGCETAIPGSLCWDHVRWSISTGFGAHPEWYEGLTAESTPEAFQDHIHGSNRTACPKPACNAQPFEPPTLFCWSVVRAEGYEPGLIRAQLDRKAGIFACDSSLVVSDGELGLVGADQLHIATTKVTGFTVAGTSPNAPIFVEAFKQIRIDGRYKMHTWMVKVDADTVLIPDRLRAVLLPGQTPRNPYPPPYPPAPGAGVWAPNCDKMVNWGAGWGASGLWPMMYGSVEILSRQAVDNYFANEELCKSSIPGWEMMGEDRYLGLCLRQLKAGEMFLKQGDNLCGGGSCGDGQFQAYHPYKDTATWLQCWDAATAE